MKSLVGRLVTVAVLVGIGWVILAQGVWMKDQLTVWQFAPDSEVTRSIERTKLTEHSLFLAEASRAQFADANTFNDACRDQIDGHNGGYTTLGCYISPYGSIYAYRISDQQLEGIDDVVLIHEILHAAWDRLSEDERDTLAQQLEVAYKQVRTNELADRMEHYANTQPGERTNELHSILATEFATLTPELEEYYRKYFTDRQVVVALYKEYNAPFEKFETKLERLEKKINDAEQYLKTQNAALKRDIQTHSTEMQQLQRERATLDRTSQNDIDAYNARVSALNTQANQLNQRSQRLQALYRTYAGYISEYNDTSIAFNKLGATLDSSAIPEAQRVE